MKISSLEKRIVTLERKLEGNEQTKKTKTNPPRSQPMNKRLNEVRQPVSIPLSQKVRNSAFILMTGIMLGLLSKVLDEMPGNELPLFLEVLDLRNFFSRLGVWLFIAVVISLYSKSPGRSALNVFMFFAGMIGSYYLYTVQVAGFFPKSYMMIWIGMTVISPFLAFVCWYARGKGHVAVAISVMIFVFMSRQVFAFGYWYFDILYGLDFLLWIAMTIIIYQSPKQMAQVAGIGSLLFILTTGFRWGIW